jgi:hypothetical protein
MSIAVYEEDVRDDTVYQEYQAQNILVFGVFMAVHIGQQCALFGL